MDIEAVRTFTAVARTGQFQIAADDLSITQQGVSRRVKRLEAELGTALFRRLPTGAALTVDGRAFLPHAAELVAAHDLAKAAVTGGVRPLRVDVLNYRIAPAELVRRFHAAHPDIELDVLTLPNTTASDALDELLAGNIDATFRWVPNPDDLPAGLIAIHAIDDEHQLLVGPDHPLASREDVDLEALRHHRLWIPGARPEMEWTAFYDEFAARHDLTLAALGPNLGTEALLETLADSAELGTLVGAYTKLVWPASYGLKRIPVRPSTPYPHYLVTRQSAHSHGLAALVGFVRGQEQN